MNFTNFHCHTKYSDGHDSAENMVIAGTNKKMKIIGFSEHSPIPFFTEWNMKYENICNYIEEIDSLKRKYSNDIEIYKGLEIDYIENITGVQNWKHLNLDYTIGSIHFLKKFPDGEYFMSDFRKEQFQKGLVEIFENDKKKLVAYYYQQINDMIKICKPDIIGHFDVIEKFNKGKFFFDADEKWYKDFVNETLEIVKQNDCIIEINTRSYYKNLTESFYPNNWILNECKKMNIPVMINSDAHDAEDIDNGLNEALKLLLHIGFKTVRVLYNNKWKDIQITEKGLIF